MTRHSICAVVPVYNAENTLEKLVELLTQTLAAFQQYHIVLVDDASRDNSSEVMRQLHQKHDNITAVFLDQNAGQQSAVLCGLRQSRSDYTVIIDDDLEHNPADIPKLYERMQQGYDVVYGVNAQQSGSGLFRDFGAWLRDRLFDRITDKPKNQKVCSFRIINWQTVQRVCTADTRFVYISLEILRKPVHIDNVPVRYDRRIRSGYHPLKLIALLLKMVIYYSPRKVFRRMRKHGSCYQIHSILPARSKV